MRSFLGPRPCVDVMVKNPKSKPPPGVLEHPETNPLQSQLLCHHCSYNHLTAHQIVCITRTAAGYNTDMVKHLTFVCRYCPLQPFIRYPFSKSNTAVLNWRSDKNLGAQITHIIHVRDRVWFRDLAGLRTSQSSSYGNIPRALTRQTLNRP